VTYPQQGGYGPPQGVPGPQQGGYGPPPPGYPPQGGYGHYPPGPPKNNTGMIVGIVVAVVAVIAAVVLVIVLNGGDDDPKNKAGDGGTSDGGGNPPVEIPGPNMPGEGGDSDSDSGDSGNSGGSSSPEEVADAAATVIETQDTSLVDQLACTSAQAEELKAQMSELPPGMEIQATATDVQTSGNTASATIELTAEGASDSFTLEMESPDGDTWCVSGI
jgi:hypothetical protein